MGYQAASMYGNTLSSFKGFSFIGSATTIVATNITSLKRSKADVKVSAQQHLLGSRFEVA